MKNRKINFIKLGILLFGVSIILWNCVEEQFIENEVETPIQINAKTVSFKDAIAHFNSKKEKIKLKRTYSKGTENPLEVTPDWNTLEFNDIAYTDANLTTANTEINRDGKYSSQLYFINVNNHIRNVIFTIYNDEVDDNGNVINGRIFFNDLNGKFLDGYIIENGVFTKRYIIQNRNQTQKASFLPLFLFQTENDDIDYSCWVYSDGELDEVVVTAYLQDSDENGGGGSGESSTSNPPGNPDYSSYINGATSNGFSTNPGSPNSLSSGQVTSAAAAILMAASIEPDENGNCPDGYTKNPTTGKCDTICTGGKFYNETSRKCECPDGLNEDYNGNCVDKPCMGDPVKNPEIAPQLGPSGMDGGLHNTCTRTGSGCAGNSSRKTHDGVDIKNPYGAPIFAMYDGTARFHTQTDKQTGIINGAGHYVSITSTINGETVRNVYFHMQENGRASGTINAGDIIGYQGISGNLGNAIKQESTTSHVHIKTRVNGVKADPLDYLATTIDPSTGQVTNPCR